MNRSITINADGSGTYETGRYVGRAANRANRLTQAAASRDSALSNNRLNQTTQNASIEEDYTTGRAALDVWESDQAIADGKARAGSDVAALTESGQRSVGGGRFRRAAGRNRTVLGSAITGGLDAANRSRARTARESSLAATRSARQATVATNTAAQETALREAADIESQQIRSERMV